MTANQVLVRTLHANLLDLFANLRPRPVRRCPDWVNNGLYRQPCHTSAYPPEADENDAKAEVAVGMSAVGGRADLACQELSGPFLAKSGHSTVPPLSWNSARIDGTRHGRRADYPLGERSIKDRSAAISSGNVGI